MVKIVCVGSLNHDIAVWLDRRPVTDETIHGERVEEFRGGKGANQIVAAARLGAETAMIGCVGSDARGQFLIDGLIADGVDASGVGRSTTPTGVALITIDPEDVSIIVVAGANASLDEVWVSDCSAVIADADVLLLQGEVPASAAARAAEIARAAGTTVVFNPAPFNDVAEAVAPLADVVIVNRNEAIQLGPTNAWLVVTTLGQGGCDVTTEGGTEHVAPFEAEVVDPTGAGDCFAAALAIGLAEGLTPVDAARFANAAGSLAVEVAGAQPSLPTRPDVEKRLARG
jgi:ribokinase